MSQATTLVLFDIDGTLVRGAAAHHKQALIDGIHKVTGLTTHLDGIATSGMLDCDLIAAMLKTAGYSETHTREAMLQIMDECQNAYCSSCVSGLDQKVCPGVSSLLSELHARAAVLGLVTGNLSGIAWRKLELAGLRQYFSIGAFAEDAATRTALAQIARHRAIDRGLVSARCLTSLIGDHPNDIQAAKENGFKSVAVATGLIGRDALAASGPDILVSTLDELDVETLF
jgi:phosphoglycolate phosphatase